MGRQRNKTIVPLLVLTFSLLALDLGLIASSTKLHFAMFLAALMFQVLLLEFITSFVLTSVYKGSATSQLPFVAALGTFASSISLLVFTFRDFFRREYKLVGFAWLIIYVNLFSRYPKLAVFLVVARWVNVSKLSLPSIVYLQIEPLVALNLKEKYIPNSVEAKKFESKYISVLNVLFCFLLVLSVIVFLYLDISLPNLPPEIVAIIVPVQWAV